MSKSNHPTMLHLGPGHLTKAGRSHPYGEAMLDLMQFSAHLSQMGEEGFNPMAGSASFSDYLEAKVLEHITGKGALTMPTFYLALCTAEVTDAKTGSTITEATYTGYARLKVEAASWGAASTGAAAIKNSAKLEFAACTGGTSTVTYWAGCDALTVGNALCWGTVTSTVISTTQTPATVAVGGLEITLD